MNSESNDLNEQRQEYRLQAEERVYLALPNPDENSEPPYQIQICTSVDMSANGFQLILDSPLPIGNYYEICIALKNPEEKLHLIAESKWSTPTKSGDYLNGFVICDAEERDTVSWKKTIADRLLSSIDNNI